MQNILFVIFLGWFSLASFSLLEILFFQGAKKQKTHELSLDSFRGIFRPPPAPSPLPNPRQCHYKQADPTLSHLKSLSVFSRSEAPPKKGNKPPRPVLQVLDPWLSKRSSTIGHIWGTASSPKNANAFGRHPGGAQHYPPGKPTPRRNRIKRITDIAPPQRFGVGWAWRKLLDPQKCPASSVCHVDVRQLLGILLLVYQPVAGIGVFCKK